MTFALHPLGSPLWEGLIAALCLGLWIYGLYVSRYHSLKVRWATGLLRLMILSVGWLILHEATFISKTMSVEPMKSAILVDRSGSMSTYLSSESGLTRLDRATEVVETIRQSELKTSLYSFDEQLVQGLPTEVPSAGTQFQDALSQLLASESNLAQIVLISDGHDFSPLTGMTSEEQENWLSMQGMPPIHSVYIGTMEDEPDLLIHSIEAPSFSYIRAPLKIDVTILARNLSNSDPQVQLLEDEKVIQFQTPVLDEHGFGRVNFEIYPDRVGEHLYQIHVPAHARESNTLNNSQFFMVETGRDKISVLHIAGSVTPDLQGLRALFENDPFIELTAFYILRTREHLQIGTDGRLIPPDEMALVQFPVEEIFDRQLYSFDVVVFQDFDAGNYFQNSYQARKLMQKIVLFVKENRGGLIVIAGPKTASGPSLALSPVGDILPIIPKKHRTPYIMETRQMKATETGKHHPVLIGFGSSLPEIFGLMDTHSLHAEADLLLQTPKKEPLLATRHVGKGRTIFLNSSSSWVWRREAMSEGKTSTEYDLFWRQVLKWVSGDPSLNPTQLKASTSQEQPLQVHTDLQLRNVNYVPLKNRKGTLTIRSAQSRESEALQTVPFTTSTNGMASLSLNLKQPGYYQMELQAGKGVPKTVRNLFLGGSVAEHQKNEPQPETLKILSSLTGGRFFDSPESFSVDDIQTKDKTIEKVIETKRVKLRDSLFLLPFILILAALEWIIRRSHHMA